MSKVPKFTADICRIPADFSIIVSIGPSMNGALRVLLIHTHTLHKIALVFLIGLLLFSQESTCFKFPPPHTNWDFLSTNNVYFNLKMAEHNLSDKTDSLRHDSHSVNQLNSPVNMR